MMTSILPKLAWMGYHITVYVTPTGEEVLRNNPHIDRFVVQDPDAVPNYQLGDFWAYERKKYSKWINLSEVIERTLLSMPGTMVHGWPKEARHALCNKNYLQMTHMIAGISCDPEPSFFATPLEHQWAERERRRIGGNDVAMFCLAGSAVHKYWPNLDEGIAYLTEMGLHVVTVGDEMCQKKEEGFDKNLRVHCRAGKWTLRQTLAFAQRCDLVIGPETGVLNAVSHIEPVGKIVLLSHSTHENLTRDWPNTVALEPKNTACYPCHRMHYGFQYCTEGKVNGETVGALCQLNISARDVCDAAATLLNRRGQRDVAN